MWGWNYYGGGPEFGAWGMIGMLVMVLFWGLLVWGIVASVRHYSTTRSGYQHSGPARSSAAMDELRLRYAKGEIDDEEFERRRANLEKDL